MEIIGQSYGASLGRARTNVYDVASNFSFLSSNKIEQNSRQSNFQNFELQPEQQKINAPTYATLRTYSIEGKATESWPPIRPNDESLSSKETRELQLGNDHQVLIVVRNSEGEVVDTIPDDKSSPYSETGLSTSSTFKQENTTQAQTLYHAIGNNVNLLI